MTIIISGLRRILFVGSGETGPHLAQASLEFPILPAITGTHLAHTGGTGGASVLVFKLSCI